jgi:anti-sigma factor RsiW
MTRCKQLERFYAEYVCDLLDEERVAFIEEHLHSCFACVREIEAVQKTLRLTEEAGEMPIPGVILDNIEMNVYKRLATESPPPKRVHFFSQFFADFRLPAVKRSPMWIFRSAIAALVLVIGIPIATVVIDQDHPPEVPVTVMPIQLSHERIEQYRQEEIRSSRIEALEMRHLKGNDRLADLQLLASAEQAP